jgi:hypothetical protein
MPFLVSGNNLLSKRSTQKFAEARPRLSINYSGVKAFGIIKIISELSSNLIKK